VALVVLGAAVAWWTWRALADAHGFDFRLYYHGGQAAWATGHPERVASWDGTPFLAAVLALASRLLSLRGAANAITLVNAGLALGGVAVLLRRLRGTLSPRGLILMALALLTFAPLLSTVWWKQFNLIALVAGAAGFDRLRQGRRASAAVLIGLSVSIKPLLFLLPVLLLTRRATRRAGAEAIAVVAALNLAGQALLATRAGSWAALNPLIALDNFLTKSRPSNVWACQSGNLAPSAAFCRMFGPGHLALVHLLVLVAVGVLAFAVAWVLADRTGTSWELFAFICPLCAMASPLAWAHYQILLAPLFILLVVRFAQGQAALGWWLALIGAFVLASLMWLPYGTLPDQVAVAFGRSPITRAQSWADEGTLLGPAQLAQYLVVATGLLWYHRRGGITAAATGATRRGRGSDRPRRPSRERARQRTATLRE
jgi:hypothetical protein